MLRSLRATLPPGLSHEIILVDDGSTDGTRKWLKSLRGQPFSIQLNESNLGYAAANNRGVARAQGNLIVLLNNDLVLTRGWLEPMLQLHRLKLSVGVVGNVQLNFHTGVIDHTGIFINAKGKPEHDRNKPDFWSSRRQVIAATGACLLLDRVLWNDVGGFDERFLNGGEDIDLCLKIAARGRRNFVALDSTILHHISASPGRKRRDEANTRRLTLRWRDELIYHGARAWCQEYVARNLTAATAFAAPQSALRIWAHAVGFTEKPPAIAYDSLQHAIAHELTRWRELLGDEAEM